MTEGTIWKHLLFFALPLIAGSVFQQMYNMVDSIVVGNFVGKEALAAVGSVNPIIFALIGFFSGFATGAGVVISQYYGAGDEENVSNTVQTTVALSFILCVILSIAGVLVTDPLLRIMGSPDDVISLSSEYLKIYFAGLSGLLIYNMASGILRAVGDSRHPLYFVIFSACVNTVLDLVFVIVFHWGVAGAAWATVIAQALSAVLELWILTRTQGCYRIIWSRIKVHTNIMRKILKVGMPSAIQMTITAISNVFVQSYINAFDSSVMAAWSAYLKLDAFMMLPMMNIGLSATTFVGQNVGAGKISRAKQGTKTAFLQAEAITIVVMIILMVFAPQLVRLFTPNEEVIQYGTFLIRLMSPFYVTCCVNQVFSGSLRGAGDTRAPMIIMLMSFVVFRQIYLFIVSRTLGTLTWVALGYPAGWIICSVTTFIYYRSGSWRKQTYLITEQN